MKTFILSLIVFSLVIGVILLTGNIFAKRTADLSEAAKRLPDFSNPTQDKPKPSQAIESFVKKWASARKIIHFIIGHDEADKIDETLTELRIRYVMGDLPGYMAAREKLLLAIHRLSDSESLSFDSVT